MPGIPNPSITTARSTFGLLMPGSCLGSGNRGRPVFNLLGGHRAERFEPGILVSPEPDVREVLFARQQSPEASLRSRQRPFDLTFQSIGELFQNRAPEPFPARPGKRIRM